ncbi:MAG: hypothetical protein C4289_09550, partial [Chloroflexota bacterium]
TPAGVKDFNPNRCLVRGVVDTPHIIEVTAMSVWLVRIPGMVVRERVLHFLLGDPPLAHALPTCDEYTGVVGALPHSSL